MDSPLQNETEKVWDWAPCVYDVKRVTNETETIWNLGSSIQLTLPGESGAAVQPLVTMRIEMSRNFIYTENIGWNWHKSWNMPDMVCELDITHSNYILHNQIRDPQTNEKLAPPEKIHAELQIVKTAVNPTQTFHLLDVGLKGNPKAEMENGKCVFTGLKFDSTSYNHEHSKFHLVITMYLTQNKFEFPQVLESKISPPIFIDSRKSARDISKQRGQKIQSYLDPFLPETLEKSFIKRDSKIKYSAEEEISSNVEGLINYFSAPNIRHKVKHPLFLAIKFHQCISLYINTTRIPSDSEERIIEAIQQILFESYQQNQGAIMKIRLENKPLIIGVNTTQGGKPASKHKKILEFLDPLKNDIVEIIIDPVGVPKCFMQLVRINELAQTYKRVYSRLVNMKFKLATCKQPPQDQVKVEVQKGKTVQQEPDENPDRVRKIIKIQPEEGDDYMGQLRVNRTATMNAVMQVTPKPEMETKPESNVKVEESMLQRIQEVMKKEQQSPPNAPPLRQPQTLPQPTPPAQQQTEELPNSYNQLLNQFSNPQQLLQQQRQMQEYLQMQIRIQMFQQLQQQKKM